MSALTAEDREALARAYYEPLGWDLDDLDPDDLRDCITAFGPVAELVAAIRDRAVADALAEVAACADEWDRFLSREHPFSRDLRRTLARIPGGAS